MSDQRGADISPASPPTALQIYNHIMLELGDDNKVVPIQKIYKTAWRVFDEYGVTNSVTQQHWLHNLQENGHSILQRLQMGLPCPADYAGWLVENGDGPDFFFPLETLPSEPIYFSVDMPRFRQLFREFVGAIGLKDLGLEQFHTGSDQMVRWKCEKGHVWFATIRNRAKGGIGCADCWHQTEEGKNALKKAHKPESVEKRKRSMQEYFKTERGRDQLKKAQEIARKPESVEKRKRSMQEYSKTERGRDQAEKRKRFMQEYSKTERGRDQIAASHTPAAIDKRKEYFKTERGRDQIRRATAASHTPAAIDKQKISFSKWISSEKGQNHLREMRKWISSEKGQNHLREMRKLKRKVTQEQAGLIRQRVAKGESRRALALEYHVSPPTIGNIVCHRFGY